MDGTNEDVGQTRVRAGTVCDDELSCVSNCARAGSGPGWHMTLNTRVGCFTGVARVFPFGRTFTVHRAGASVTPKFSVKNAQWHCRLGPGPLS